MELEQGIPVRVELSNGKKLAGVVVGFDDEWLELSCQYKFVRPEVSSGYRDRVVETLMGFSGASLLEVANDTGRLCKALRGGILGLRRGGFKLGMGSVVADVLMDEMEDELVAQQAPITTVIPVSNIDLISSLVDEGQEKLFDRWASGH